MTFEGCEDHFAVSKKKKKQYLTGSRNSFLRETRKNFRETSFSIYTSSFVFCLHRIVSKDLLKLVATRLKKI